MDPLYLPTIVHLHYFTYKSQQVYRICFPFKHDKYLRVCCYRHKESIRERKGYFPQPQAQEKALSPWVEATKAGV